MKRLFFLFLLLPVYVSAQQSEGYFRTDTVMADIVYSVRDTTDNLLRVEYGFVVIDLYYEDCVIEDPYISFIVKKFLRQNYLDVPENWYIYEYSLIDLD